MKMKITNPQKKMAQRLERLAKSNTASLSRRDPVAFAAALNILG